MPFLDLNGLNYFTQKIKEIFATKQDASNAEQNALQRANDFTILKTNSTLEQAKQYADSQDIFYDTNKFSLSGENVTFFKDKEKQHLIFPKTKTNAVSDSSGAILDSILSSIKSNIETEKQNNKIFTATFRVDAWQNSGTSFTQSAPCTGMKESYSTGAPWFYKTENDVTNAELQRMLNVLTSGIMTTENNNITATITKQPTCDIQIYLRRINTV